ncbi:MAG TPA: hypothetical protein VEW91_06865, partial [bacterium]|nr:hypothetical protein [bacterium]
MSAARRRGGLLHGIFLVLIVAYSLFPIYMMAIESLKSVDEDVFGNPLLLSHPDTQWYEDLFEPAEWVRGTASVDVIPFLVWLKNTGIVFGATLVIVLSTGIAAGYALGRLRPPGWRWWRRAL